jgi:type IV pilus assembly protein PilO
MNINNLEIDFKNPKLQKIVIAVVVTVAVNYIYFFTSYMPFFYPSQKTEIVQREGRFQSLVIKVAEAKKASENLKKLEVEIAKLHDEWEIALSCLPEKREIASLLRRVTLAGERSGVRFQLFEPQAILYHGVYDEHPVSVKIEGGYHEIGSFFGRLNDMDRIVQVSGIALNSERNDEEEQVVQGEMIISAFTVPTQPLEDEGVQPGNSKRENNRVEGSTNGSRIHPDDSDE